MITAFNNYFSEKTEILKALLKFSGIGKKMALQALDRSGISSRIKIGNISASQLAGIKAIIEQNYDVDNERRVLIKKNIWPQFKIIFPMAIKAYRKLKLDIAGTSSKKIVSATYVVFTLRKIKFFFLAILKVSLIFLFNLNH